MTNPLSTLGIVHTAISLVPLVAGLLAFYQAGRIDPRSPVGRWYVYGMIIGVLTAFGLSSTGGFNAGHAIGILCLIAIAVGSYAQRIRALGGLGEYLETGAMSFSFFLMMIPTLNESLSRLPPSNPIGHGPDSPPVQMAVMVALLVLAVGVLYQFYRIHRRRMPPARPAH
ncbi:hypothetical protein P3W53_14790 [Pseudomonas denitrificans (nom. rej.)]|nr:hypothetical protein [Pseudomonas denitrificans (nom. rej.)]